MSEVEILGVVAGVFTSFGLVPQVLRIWTLKDAKEISLPFNLMFLTGTTLWLFYGLSLQLLSVALWNAVTAVLMLILLGAKLKYGMGKPDS